MTANHFRFIERRSTVVFKSFSVPLELVNLTAERVLLKIGRIVTPLECHVGVTQTHFIACRNQVKARPAHIRIWRLPSGKSRADNSTPIPQDPSSSGAWFFGVTSHISAAESFV